MVVAKIQYGAMFPELGGGVETREAKRRRLAHQSSVEKASQSVFAQPPAQVSRAEFHFKKRENEAIFFGRKAWWEARKVEVGDEPPLREDIEEILDSPCPYTAGKRVRETHILFLVPKTINGEPTGLKLLEEVAGGKYFHYYANGNIINCLENVHLFGANATTDQIVQSSEAPIKESYWALIKRPVDGQRLKRCGEGPEERYHTARLLELLIGGIFTEFRGEKGPTYYPTDPYRTGYVLCKQKRGKYKFRDRKGHVLSVQKNYRIVNVQLPFGPPFRISTGNCTYGQYVHLRRFGVPERPI